MNVIQSYDIDGVIYMGEDLNGLTPRPGDVIITGRSYQQSAETLRMLHGRGIYNTVFFNPLPRKHKDYCREASGRHKANVLNSIRLAGTEVSAHYEDDPIQAKMIKDHGPENMKIIMVLGAEVEL